MLLKLSILALLLLVNQTLAQSSIENSSETSVKLPEESGEIPDVILGDSDDESEDDKSEKGGNSVDKVMKNVFSEFGKLNLGIDNLDSLKQQNKCEVNHRTFRCTAATDEASLSLDSDHKLSLILRIVIRGKLRHGRIVKIRMEDATVDVKKLPDDMSMWRPRGLRQIKRQLKRRYLRMAIATRRLSRKMMPVAVKV